MDRFTPRAPAPPAAVVPEAIAIVVPVFNEEECVEEFYARVERLGLASSVIFVDNGSTDGTVARLERCPAARLIRHTRNEGYGASILDGIAATTADQIVIIDADLEYPPEVIITLLGALADHAVVYASRFSGAEVPDMPLFRRLGNRGISGMYNLLFGQRTTDFCTGLKGLRRRALPLSTLRQQGFEHAVELGAMIALAGEHIHEIPVRYMPRDRGRSKMRHIPEALKFIMLTTGYWLWCRVLGRPLPSFPLAGHHETYAP